MKQTDDAESLQEAANALIALKNNYGFQLLMAQLSREAQQDLEALAEIDPSDIDKVRELQASTKFLNWIKSRINMLIEQGVQPEIVSEMTEQDFIDG